MSSRINSCIIYFYLIYFKGDTMKKGFTLSEVLITLGIIGIIAAMTLPALVGNYKMKTFEVAFKKQYSLIQNALNVVTLQEGISGCYIFYPHGTISYKLETSDCELLQERMISLLKLKKYPEDFKDNYAKKDVILANGGKSINSTCNYDYFVYVSEPYIANDGTIFMFYTTHLMIDVNGEKGPNKWGHDVFFMVYSNHNNYSTSNPKIFLTDEFCSIIEKGGKFPRTILRNQKENSKTNGYTW